MKRIFLMTALVMGVLYSYAQMNLRGQVIDAVTKTPLSGATISFAGKGITSTDQNGQFSIDCRNTTRITISFLGYQSVQQIIKDCEGELNIALMPISKALNEVEITATSNPNKSILYQPQTITKVNNLELKRSTGLFLDDAINTNVPGVLMERRSVSGGQQINIRGYGSGTRGTNGTNSNFDIQGVKVYLNGIPLTDAEGITILDDVDFNSIGDVEVVKGPSGTLYGLAVAGVVNLKTIKPEKGKTSIGQEVMVGSYGLRRYTSHFLMGGEHSSLMANYGYQESDGFTLHNASHKRFVNLAGDFQINSRQFLSTYFGYADSYDERAGELKKEQFENHDYSGNPNYIKNNAHSGVTSFKAGVTHRYNFNNNISNSTTVFGTGVTNNSSSAAGWTDKQPINFGLRSTLDMQFSLKSGGTISGITGVETQHQFAQSISYGMSKNPADPTGYNIIDTARSNQYTQTGTTSVFSEWTLALPHDLSFTAGIGLSNMRIELNDRKYALGKPAYFEKTYAGMLSPHLAINKVFSKEFSVYVSYSKGYKAPVSSYFFIPFAVRSNAVVPGTGIVNTGLKPEIGNQFEIGSKGSLLHDKLSYQLALFNALFTDKMTAVAVTEGSTTLYSYVVNGGKQNHKGIEALVKYNVYESGKSFISAVSPFANVTYSKFEYEDFVYLGKNYKGNAVAGVPPVTFNAGWDVLTKLGLYANATYSYRDEMPIVSDGSIKAPAFSLVNAKLGYRRSLSAHFDLDAYFGANNMTGSRYYLMAFINQQPDSYIPGPDKINYFGGINIKYIF
jgi:iron complex outermembrane receptor protein